MAMVRLAKGRVKPVWAGHPWVYAQAIHTLEGAPAAGDVVQVRDFEGKFIGQGFWSPQSAIPIRILSRIQDQALDAAWLQHTIMQAAQWRKDLLKLPSAHTSGYRLIHSEGDQLGGLIVDMYGTHAVVQFLTVGMKRREALVFAAVEQATGATNISEVARSKTSQQEGFSAQTRHVLGADDRVLFSESGLHYELDLPRTQKTGFYFDQRATRSLLAQYVEGRSVLDAFCYVGAFSLAAARAGAQRVVGIDSSVMAITTAGALAQRNGLAERTTFEHADVERALINYAQAKQQFGCVVLDPPKLIPSAKHTRRGGQAYLKLNTAALRVVEAGGLLLTCSCSANMTLDDFLRMLGMAAAAAHRSVSVVHIGFQGADHPSAPVFFDGRYLKYVLARVE